MGAMDRCVPDHNGLRTYHKMTKRFLYIIALLLVQVSSLYAQEDLLERILSANERTSLKAGFTQTRHSPMLEENLVSEGLLYLQQPDKIRWEILKPVHKVSVHDGGVQGGRQFRLPGRKDFSVTEISNDKQYFVTLVPIRNDLRRLFTRIVLIVQNDSLLIKEIQLFGRDGDYTILSFKDIQRDVELDPSLFIKD